MQSQNPTEDLIESETTKLKQLVAEHAFLPPLELTTVFKNNVYSIKSFWVWIRLSKGFTVFCFPNECLIRGLYFILAVYVIR